MHPKIKSNHLEKIVYLYIRQSTNQQLIDNQESLRVQLQLKDKLLELGFTNIEVVDTDLGKSAAGYANRPGFARILNDVCCERVSAVAAWEASRLARSNFEWQNLIRFCQITGTLVIDENGIYDLTNIDDIAMLGIKATMSEYELNILTKRARAGLLEKARRGELYMSLPMGYHLTDDGKFEIDPNERIRQSIQLVFDKFTELGSARQVLLYFRQDEIKFPKARHHRAKRTIIWEPALYSTIIWILKHPVYAGAYVYGRRQNRVFIRDNQAVKTSHHVSMESWKVLIPDHHPAYISWDQFIRNQHQLRDNSNKVYPSSKGAPKMGSSLLSGLINCGHCGRKLTVKYSGRNASSVRYICRGSVRTTGQTANCLTTNGKKLEAAVVGELLNTVQPIAIHAAIEAEKQLSAERTERQQHLELALEQARYEAERRQRQFDAIEPENRIVLRQLQALWNEALANVEQLEHQLQQEKQHHHPFDEGQRQQLYELANDLPRLWELKSTDERTKKRILRTLIEGIIANKQPNSQWNCFTIRWAGGVHSEIRLKQTKPGENGRTTDKKAVELVKELVAIVDDQDIARILNRCGLKTGAGQNWNQSRVKWLRQSQGIPAFCKQSYEKSGVVNLQQAAEQLKISPPTVVRFIKSGIIQATQIVPYAPWIIHVSELEKQSTIKAVLSLKKNGKANFQIKQNKLNL